MRPEYISNPEEAKEYLPRYRLFYGMITFTFIIFCMRLWYLQVIQGTELRDFSEKNRIKQIKIMAPRGLMFDRDGKVLVENHPGFEAVLSPQYIENLQTLATAVAPIIGMESEKLIQKVQKSRKQNGPFAQIKVKDNLSRDEVFRLKRIRLDNPGLDIRESVVRHYPLLENGAQLFGYVAEISKKQIPLYNQMYRGLVTFDQGDIIGQTGLEEVLEKNIRGSDGTQFLQVDAFGRETTTATPNIYGEQIIDKDPIPGNNVMLTIDREVQQAAYKSFIDNERIGALIAMKSDGEILAWVSTPSYDPNEFARGIGTQLWSKLINDQFKPLRNKVIQDYFSPGSTFKPFMALAALQDKVITPTTIINCPGFIMFGKRQYHDHIRGGLGNVSVYEALERSSNVFFYKMGIALGIDKMYNYISPFGIGQKTGVELPRETAGLMPSAAWKKSTYGEEWQPGENLSVAIGQGFVETTPIQMAVAYNAIGLEGKVFKPFVIKKLLDSKGQVVKETEPHLLRNLQEMQSTGISISEENFKVVKEGMRRVANGDRGTARFLKIPGVEMAGKTGTSQVMGFSANDIYSRCENRPILQRHNGWFVAWAPADKPEITVAAVALHACHGNIGAGPLVRDTIRAYFDKYHPDIIAEGMKNKKGAHVKVEAPQTLEGE
ncbi:MAG: penicillin-binding protein 2 [Bdellovibrio sp. CG10_big_fil_rev_8_21_14_0_10_47_8]|nr:MAG: penicillin-binding protein 2 [Bdellovibrio sp. CG10_big_fil_rev_8_21_14_0_10_47_8]